MDCRCPLLQGGLSHSTSQHFRSRQSTVPHSTAGSRPEFCRINEQLEEEEICSLQLLINWWTAEQLHQDLVIGIKVQNPLDARHTLAMPMDTPAFWCRRKGNPRFSGTKPTVSSFAPCPGPWRWREEPRIVGGKKVHCVHPSAFGGTVVAFFSHRCLSLCCHCAIEKWSKRMEMKWIIAIQFNEATQGRHGCQNVPWPGRQIIARLNCRHPDSSTTLICTCVRSLKLQNCEAIQQTKCSSSIQILSTTPVSSCGSDSPRDTGNVEAWNSLNPDVSW